MAGNAWHRVLILGGTGEAAALADSAHRRFGDSLRVVTSLAGRTDKPKVPAGELRIGGFGGAAALAAYLREEGVDFLIDATHPFAACISAAAREACDAAGVPRLTLARPSWRATAGDRWIEVAGVDEAARQLPALGKRVFLTIGRRGLAPFARIAGCWFLVRLVEAPRNPLPFAAPDFELLVTRGPFAPDTERALLHSRGIDVVVAKASGGEATEAKLIAARALGLPVILLRRPAAEPGERVETIEEALAWLERGIVGLDAAAPVPT